MAMRWRDGWLIRPTAQVRGTPIKGRRWKYPLESMRDDATAWVGDAAAWPGAPPRQSWTAALPAHGNPTAKLALKGAQRQGVADWAGDAESRG